MSTFGRQNRTNTGSLLPKLGVSSAAFALEFGLATGWLLGQLAQALG